MLPSERVWDAVTFSQLHAIEILQAARNNDDDLRVEATPYAGMQGHGHGHLHCYLANTAGKAGLSKSKATERANLAIRGLCYHKAMAVQNPLAWRGVVVGVRLDERIKAAGTLISTFGCRGGASRFF